MLFLCFVGIDHYRRRCSVRWWCHRVTRWLMQQVRPLFPFRRLRRVSTCSSRTRVYWAWNESRICRWKWWWPSMTRPNQFSKRYRLNFVHSNDRSERNGFSKKLERATKENWKGGRQSVKYFFHLKSKKFARNLARVIWYASIDESRAFFARWNLKTFEVFDLFAFLILHILNKICFKILSPSLLDSYALDVLLFFSSWTLDRFYCVTMKLISFLYSYH